MNNVNMALDPLIYFSPASVTRGQPCYPPLTNEEIKTRTWGMGKNLQLLGMEISRRLTDLQAHQPLSHFPRLLGPSSANRSPVGDCCLQFLEASPGQGTPARTPPSWMSPALPAQECFKNSVVHFIWVWGAGEAVSSFFLGHVLQEEGFSYR